MKLALPAGHVSLSARLRLLQRGVAGAISRTLDCGFGCGVGGVSEGSGDAVLVPADALVVDRVFEAAFIVVEARGAGFHLDEFLDVLSVHAFENEKVDWRPDEF